jgi:hypothetical protein
MAVSGVAARRASNQQPSSTPLDIPRRTPLAVGHEMQGVGFDVPFVFAPFLATWLPLALKDRNDASLFTTWLPLALEDGNDGSRRNDMVGALKDLNDASCRNGCLLHYRIGMTRVVGMTWLTLALKDRNDASRRNDMVAPYTRGLE